MDPRHPTIELVFAIIGGARPAIDRALEHELSNLATSRTWSLGPPEFAELAEENRCGGVLRLFSALPPWGEKLPREADAANLEETAALIEMLVRFSAVHRLDVEFELGGDDVGAIQTGVPDASLAEGLIGEWRRALQARET